MNNLFVSYQYIGKIITESGTEIYNGFGNSVIENCDDITNKEELDICTERLSNLLTTDTGYNEVICVILNFKALKVSTETVCDPVELQERIKLLENVLDDILNITRYRISDSNLDYSCLLIESEYGMVVKFPDLEDIIEKMNQLEKNYE